MFLSLFDLTLFTSLTPKVLKDMKVIGFRGYVFASKSPIKSRISHN